MNGTKVELENMYMRTLRQKTNDKVSGKLHLFSEEHSNRKQKKKYFSTAEEMLVFFEAIYVQ
jgi:hypothetical protein